MPKSKDSAVSYMDVVDFVDASSQLAATLEAAIRTGASVPPQVTLALNNYKIKAATLQNVLDFVERNKSQLN